MSQDETEKVPLTAAERKAGKWESDKSRGYVELTVRVPADPID